MSLWRVFEHGNKAITTSIVAARFAGFSSSEADSLGLTLTEKDYEHGRVWVEPSGYHDLHCLVRESLSNLKRAIISFSTELSPAGIGS